MVIVVFLQNTALNTNNNSDQTTKYFTTPKFPAQRMQIPLPKQGLSAVGCLMMPCQLHLNPPLVVQSLNQEVLESGDQ